MTPTHKDTYEYCEQLIDEQINSMIESAHLSSSGEALQTFKEDLKVLYKHLDNIKAMKTSYAMGR